MFWDNYGRTTPDSWVGVSLQAITATVTAPEHTDTVQQSLNPSAVPWNTPTTPAASIAHTFPRPTMPAIPIAQTLYITVGFGSSSDGDITFPQVSQMRSTFSPGPSFTQEQRNTARTIVHTNLGNLLATRYLATPQQPRETPSNTTSIRVPTAAQQFDVIQLLQAHKDRRRLTPSL